MEKSTTKRTEVNAVITSVSGPATVQSIAAKQGLNPQEVFVRINFKVVNEDKSVSTDEYTSSNKLRFFGIDGYKKLLAVKESGEPIRLAITVNDKGSLCYLANEDRVAIEDLFAIPVDKNDNRKDINDLF